MAKEQATFFDKAKSALNVVCKKTSPTLKSAYNTFQETVVVVGDVLEGTKSAWQFAKAGDTLIQSTIKLSWNVGKAVLYDAPSTFKAAFYDDNEAEARAAYEETSNDLMAANDRFWTGINAGVELVQSGANIAYYTGDAAYHTGKAVYHAGSTVINAGVLTAEVCQTVAEGVLDGAYRVKNALGEVYQHAAQESAVREINSTEGVFTAYTVFSGSHPKFFAEAKTMIPSGLFSVMTTTFGSLMK